ncbi:PaaI family thioesterase [Gordonia pseudamarae]|uniref:PaaI family thioesterase n=1 Tax=Gordonia pseudamarae TaxID=2831662 RepID=A0ABX6ILC0_9ACTN|nr:MULTISPECIES: PaaI family thioesterase [Gordonia]MBD0020801.1 PaaI family thioesterase [Gordonia sp. (in: high G+C Gram-positive bacteria)]QHN27831.1 PaaI family thioesterase [Gordonia pseudamarae]QHN36713.1 PaaI family thioesterase [Gordonia pseudamarae]
MPVTELLICGAEALVRVRTRAFAAGVCEFTVRPGPWLHDPVAGCSRGSLGVVLDDVTGYLAAARAAPGRWPVSLGIRVDFLADPPLAGEPMVAVGELVSADVSGATTRGTLTDADGTVVALVTQRSHFIDAQAPASPALAFSAPEPSATVREVLGISEPSPGTVELPSTPYAANGRGHVHGGILICGAEFAAMSAIGADGRFRTLSVDINYVRPGDALAPTVFRAELCHRGRSLCVVRVVAEGPAGKPYAFATVTISRRQ